LKLINLISHNPAITNCENSLLNFITNRCYLRSIIAE